MNRLETICSGERMELFAEKAIFWPRKKTLLVADPHFGKASAFRHAGIPVPEDVTAEDLKRLDALLAATRARRMIFLGDFFHAKTGKSIATVESLNQWIANHRDLEFHLIRGNHDIHSGAVPEDWRFHITDNTLCDPPFVFSHAPFFSGEGYVVAGHIHPAVRCGMRLPCFHFGAHCAVLPAFGGFTGTHVIKPEPTDRVFVLNEGEIAELPMLTFRS
ncbi:MAG TPA: ligase-associated DNA damage response endonuclease PdeM [Chthoniobacterales bacterium]